MGRQEAAVERRRGGIDQPRSALAGQLQHGDESVDGLAHQERVLLVHGRGGGNAQMVDLLGMKVHAGQIVAACPDQLQAAL